MTSQLNPNAAVFVPVSPTRLLMMDDAIISASPGVKFEEPPTNLEYSSCPKHDDYFMRDNFSTIPNKMKELTTPSVGTVTDFTGNTQEHMEHISIDELLGIQNLVQKEITGELGKANFCGITNISFNNESGITNDSGNNNTTFTDFAEINMSGDSVVSGTTSSLKVEVSCYTITEENSDINNQAEIELKCHGLVADNSLVLPKEDLAKALISQKKRSKSSRNRYKKRSKKVEPNVIENNDGFITEHRRSPPIDLTFKPIQNFSDENPFGALQTPTTTTPTDQYYNLAELYKTPQDTPEKGGTLCEPEINQVDTPVNIPLSSILTRSLADDSLVPFEELKSPNELPPFLNPPNANRIADTELPKTPEIEDKFEIMSPKNLEHIEITIDADDNTDFKQIKQDLYIDASNSDTQEISFTAENIEVNKIQDKYRSNIDLDTTGRFLRPEYTIRPPKKECEQMPTIDMDIKSDCKLIQQNNSVMHETPKPEGVEEIKSAFTSIKSGEPCAFDIFSSFGSVPAKPEIVADQETNCSENMLDLFVEDTKPEMQETSFTNENIDVIEELAETNATFKNVFIEIECKETSSIAEVSQVSTKDDKTDSKEDAKEIELDLELHTPPSQTTPEELRNLVQGFEVINKDELIPENYSPTESEKSADTSKFNLQIESKNEEVINVVSSLNETLYSTLMDDVFTANQETSIVPNVSVKNNQIINNIFLNVTEKCSETGNVKLGASEDSIFAENPQNHSTETTDCSSLEKEENQPFPEEIILEITKSSENHDLNAENRQEVEEEVVPSTKETKLPSVIENVPNDFLQKAEGAEASLSSLEEVNRSPLIEMTEIPLTAGTVQTTLIPLELKLQEQDLSEMVISLTVTGAEADSKDKNAKENMDDKDDPVELKKPVEGVASRSSGTPTKASAKPDAPTSAVKPAATKTTTPITKSVSGAKTTTPSSTIVKTSTTKPASSSTSTKLTASAAAKPTTSNLAKSKSNASSVASSKSAASSTVHSKPAASSTASSKPAASSTVPSKPATSSAAPSKPTASSTAPSKPAAQSTVSSKPGASVPSNSNSSIVAPSKPSASTVTSSTENSTTSSKPTVSSVTALKPAVSSVTASKPTAPGGAVTKNVASSVASSKLTAVSKTAPSKPVASNSNTVKSIPPSTNTVKPAASSSTAAKSTATTAPNKKPTTTSTVKPTGSKTTSSSIKPTVTSTTSSKPVPKQLPVSETTNTALKSSSKPSTPTSSPTSPTTPKSPMMRSSTAKSAPKPEAKSPLPDKSSTLKPATDKSADKKPASTNDVKSLVKKTEAPKSSPTPTAKPSTPTKPGATGAKTVGSATKSQTSTPNKLTAAKTLDLTKQKSAGASDETSNTSAGAKKLAAAIAVVSDKTAENSKEPSRAKVAANGKPAMTTSSNVKGDPKGNKKSVEKSVPSKKVEGGKIEEKSIQVQEHKVSTTNEIATHTDEQLSLIQPISI